MPEPEPGPNVLPSRLRRAGPGDAEAIAGVQVASWRVAYAGLLPRGYLESLTVEEGARRWRRWLGEAGPAAGPAFLVEEGARVVGFASGGREREGGTRHRGELYAIYLLPEAQGRGHGRALVREVAGALVRRRWTSMLVWVLRDNLPARGFYERLGGTYLREQALAVSGLEGVVEVAYGWDDVRFSLLGR